MCFAGVVVAVWEERGFLSFFGLLWVPQELLEANPARHRVDNMCGKKCWRQCAGLVGVTRRFRCLLSWWWMRSLSHHLSTVFTHV